MAESTLSITYRTIQQELGYFNGWSTDNTSWSASELAMINRDVKAGLRQFYAPPKLPAQTRPHRWSFLRPVETLITVAPYSTGTIEVVVTDATVTLTDGVFPPWAASGEIVIDGVAYDVATRTDDTHIELTTAWAGASAADKAYVLQRYAYDLPDAFASTDGDMMFEESSGIFHTVPVIGEGRIREYRQQVSSPGEPIYAAVRPKKHIGTETTGQRWELLLHPVADKAYTLSYQCRLNPESLNESAPDTTYPPGGMMHAQTIIASCLAAAEMRFKGSKGPQWEDFLIKLESSIAIDLEQAPPSVGANTIRGRSMPSSSRVTRVTVNGVFYDGSD